MATIRMQQRRATAAQWTSANPTLAVGELGIETDTLKIKVGNGSAWNSIANYANVVPTALTEYAALSGATFTGAVNGTDLTLSGNLTVNGTTTTINSTTLSVDDKNIVLGDVAEPADNTADGGGITLKGTTDKTINWVDSTDSWTSSENIDLASTKSFKINGTDVLTSTQVLGKSLPTGDVVGTSDTQTLSNKTLSDVVLRQPLATPSFTENVYELVLTDQGDIILASNGATAGTVNVPTNASVEFPVGTQITVIQTGSGQLTISATTPGTTTINSSGATSTAPKLRVQNSGATLIKTATDTWYVVGDIS